uniref:Homeodomain 2 protein n=1 Tax=Flammulina velutipes TaxID=38945 RepID=M4MEC6_FLAVE|nr:homeodomain 2 protein [Flammulina velutipes]
MFSQRQVELLKTTSNISQRLKNRRASAATTAPPAPPTSVSIQLDLPLPESLLEELQNQTIPLSLRHTLSTAVDSLKDRFVETFCQAPLRTVSLRDSLKAQFSATIMPDLLSRYDSAKSELLSSATSIDQDHRIRFRNEFIPLFLIYFEWNPYPSALDQKLLAQKSQMTMRQVEVWFQNQRSKRRDDPTIKDKKTRKRMAIPPWLTDTIEKFIPPNELTRSARSTPEVVVEDEKVAYKRSEADKGFKSLVARRYDLSPCHGDLFQPRFPEASSALMPYRPIPPTATSFTFPPPIWERRPAASLPSHLSSHDIEQVLEKFNSLSLHSDIDKILDEPTPPAATCAFTVFTVDACQKRRLTRPSRSSIKHAITGLFRRPPSSPLYIVDLPFRSSTQSSFPSLSRTSSWSSISSGDSDVCPPTPHIVASDMATIGEREDDSENLFGGSRLVTSEPTSIPYALPGFTYADPTSKTSVVTRR